MDLVSSSPEISQSKPSRAKSACPESTAMLRKEIDDFSCLFVHITVRNITLRDIAVRLQNFILMRPCLPDGVAKTNVRSGAKPRGIHPADKSVCVS